MRVQVAMYEEVEIEEGAVSKLQAGVGRKWQHMLDISAPHTAARWGVSALVMITYAIRVYLINGAPHTSRVEMALLPLVANQPIGDWVRERSRGTLRPGVGAGGCRDPCVGVRPASPPHLSEGRRWLRVAPQAAWPGSSQRWPSPPPPPLQEVRAPPPLLPEVRVPS